MAVDYIGCGYAATVALGGLIGYLKAGSMASLGAGLTFGMFAGLGAWQITHSDSHGVMILTSAVLTGLMGYRFANSGKFMPAGLVATMSVLILLRGIYATFANR